MCFAKSALMRNTIHENKNAINIKLELETDLDVAGP